MADMLKCGQNLEGEGMADMLKCATNSGEPESGGSMKRLAEQIAYNERQYDLSCGLTAAQFFRLSKEEKLLYFPVRGAMGALYIKKAA
jgi:hypothetical protein